MRIENPILVYSRKAVEDNWNMFCDVSHMFYENSVEHSAVLVDDFGYKNLEGVDSVFTLGGDGTFIRASHYLDHQVTLGINSDCATSEGALLGLDENNIGMLEKVLRGEYDVSEEKRIAAYINNKRVEGRALNEIYFGATSPFKTSRYDIKVGRISEEHRSSGVLIANSVGSNAWYKAAGGEPFSEEGKLKYIVREAFNSEKLFKPKLLNGYINDEITFVSRMYGEAVVAFDSNKEVPVQIEDEVKIKMSKTPLRVIRIRNDN